eukprot:UN05166
MTIYNTHRSSRFGQRRHCCKFSKKLRAETSGDMEKLMTMC